MSKSPSTVGWKSVQPNVIPYFGRKLMKTPEKNLLEIEGQTTFEIVIQNSLVRSIVIIRSLLLPF